MKWGLLYRSNQLSNISERDITFLKNMGLKTIVDYRSKSEASAAPNKEIFGANTYSLDPNAKTAQLAAGSINDKDHDLKNELHIRPYETVALYKKK